MNRNGETSAVRWATYERATVLISQSTNRAGRDRDLRTLKAAFEEYNRICAVS